MATYSSYPEPFVVTVSSKLEAARESFRFSVDVFHGFDVCSFGSWVREDVVEV